MHIRTSLSAALATLLAVFVLAGCGTQVQSAAQPLRRIVYGLTLQPSGFDPHIHASSELGIPLRMVYDTLIYRDPETLAFTGGLASAWALSEDGLFYTFALRQDVMFHDGTPFNAQAVAANLDRITDPALASQRAALLLGPYERYEIIDDYTIRLVLAEPYSPLLDSLSQVYLGIASPTALTEYGPQRYQFHQVGTGPFRMVDYLPNDRLTLRRNAGYAWGPAFYQEPSQFPVEEIEFRFFEDPATRSLALESGSAQVMGELLPADARALTANNDVRVLPVAIPGQPLQFLFNTQAEPTNRLEVRQALILATNREGISDIVFQRFSPIAWGPLSAVTASYDPSLVGAYTYDLSAAQQLLANAGYRDADGNGYLDGPNGELTVRLIVPTWGLIPQVAQVLQSQWDTIGIRTVLEQVPSRSTLIDQVNTGQYNGVAWYEFGVDPVFLSRYFSSRGVNNWTGFSDPTLDNLLADAARAVDDATRQNLYAQVQRLIMENALILPIRDYVNLNAHSARYAGLQFDAYGWFPLLYALHATL